MTELIKQIRHFLDIHLGYTKKQYYKMIADEFGISQRDAREYLQFITEHKIGIK